MNGGKKKRKMVIKGKNIKWRIKETDKEKESRGKCETEKKERTQKEIKENRKKYVEEPKLRG